ncbi:MAG: hypothetical protein LBP68_06520 [Acidobacteriota bacterium]|jgi:hypothetical protein|nr:hypothetical protein [Acidobacteriota bacterium]
MDNRGIVGHAVTALKNHTSIDPVRPSALKYTSKERGCAFEERADGERHNSPGQRPGNKDGNNWSGLKVRVTKRPVRILTLAFSPLVTHDTETQGVALGCFDTGLCPALPKNRLGFLSQGRAVSAKPPGRLGELVPTFASVLADEVGEFTQRSCASSRVYFQPGSGLALEFFARRTNSLAMVAEHGAFPSSASWFKYSRIC